MRQAHDRRKRAAWPPQVPSPNGVSGALNYGRFGGPVRTVAGTIFVALINFLVTLVQVTHALRLAFSGGIILFAVCVSRQTQKRPAMRT
jgi:ribose/xylose/arabinose/galactoside ABC-type transport system permease subunit